MADILTMAGVLARGNLANDVTDIRYVGRSDGIKDARKGAGTGSGFDRTRSALSILHASSWTCEACGVRSQPDNGDVYGGMEVHHRDHDPENTDPDNLVCLCPFCHGLMHTDVMLARGLFPGHIVWAPHIEQRFFTLTAHLRAVAEVRCATLSARAGVPDAPEGMDALDAQDRLALNVRERLARIDRALHGLGIPEGLFQLDGVDMGLLVSEDQQGFGRLLGEFARKRSAYDRARLARRLHGLRYGFDYRFHPSASAYSKTYAFGGDTRDWAVIWVRERELVQGRG